MTFIADEHNGTELVILTIDDEKFIRQSFCNYLEDFDYTVLEAENGRIGLEVFEREKPDLVLVDLHMPEVGGLVVLEAIRANSPDTPIIVVSGTGVMGDAVTALQLGAWNYLLKPIEDLSVLLHAVEQALERSRLIKENREYKEHLEEMVKVRTAQLQTANKELKETRMQIIRRLGKAAEYKDNETGRHVIRVSYYSAILAEALNLEQNIIELIRQCSPMHDIGKIGIPDNILMKPGPLEPSERIVMQTHSEKGIGMLQPLPQDEIDLYRKHTVIGEDILGGSDSELLQMARRIAAYHHERWDGTGYPYQLKGDEIPIEARIVAVTDIYDALSSKRPYKDPFPEEKCLKIIRECSGTHLDPKIVDVFFENIDKIREIKESWKD
ncbi:MAG: response regulator [bacterium]|nr:response regulator [bacterium]